ncbi:MAG: hypothetical protein E2O39_09720 [Planctomycetota bacterium]|nr:MAG: hypothetical protein E2O39_09720 [Planctomycetota bacterium]
MCRFPLSTATILAGVVLAGSPLARQTECAYQEDGGLVVVEFESLDAPSGWVEETSASGFTGAGYLRWTGSNHFSVPGNAIMNVYVQLHTDGLRQLSIRNHHDDPNDIFENDIWFRADGGDWIKAASSGPATVAVWNWVTTVDEGGPDIVLDLTKGLHHFEFSARSKDFRVDRFHLYTLGHPLGTSSLQPQSRFCPGINYCIALPNSTGNAAIISATGSASVSANDLVLHAGPVPANQAGIFYYGAGTNNSAFGNGIRCVSTGGIGVFRLPPTGTANGMLTFPVDFTNPSQIVGTILPSSTWFFQAWYRDPAAGGASFNLSDGYEILFQL